MVSVISKEKKKPYLLLDKYVPVLLTAKYPEYYDQLIEYALNRQITLCYRIDILSANDIKISEDFISMAYFFNSYSKIDKYIKILINFLRKVSNFYNLKYSSELKNFIA